ncbi:hypothetical protein AC1031_010972 [Aphanomyces cochlioides]|nr:hypothetical protein AC1031_010972 [Aphanomyces cochlioides]
MEDKSAAVWTSELELRLIGAYKDQAANAKHIASGAKNLRKAGWTAVLGAFTGTSVTSTAQLQSKWRCLKNDWADYSFLQNLSVYGSGLSDERWSELDASRGKLKLSRFREKEFVHWEAMSAVIGDTMATGENIASFSSLGSAVDDSSDAEDIEHGDLSAARKRAKILHQLKKNRKRKVNTEDQDRTKEARLKALVDISNSLGRLVQLYAVKHNLENPVLATARQDDDVHEL